MVLSFKVLIFGSVAFSAFVLTLLTADVFAVDYLPASFEVPVAFGVPTVFVVLIAYTIFVKNVSWLGTLVLAFVGAEVGSFFAVTLSPWTALALPIAFSIYDIYAVFRGPLKALIGTNPNIALVGMSIRAGEFTLGLGDIVFYTSSGSSPPRSR
jgi:presenilin-like A22 family membrane protease